MVELVNIEKRFQYAVLKKVNYTFEEGKVYIIKGVSGCGKSTLLNIIGGLDRDFLGDITVDGKSLRKRNRKEFEDFRGKVSYIFQNSLLISKLTVKENLLFIKENLEKIEYYATKLGVDGLLEKYPEQLSGGERQRIALIRAMLLEPKIIIADEPTASLDSENSIKIAKLLRELTGDGCITIIATHEDCFDEVADEIISLNYGSIHSGTKQAPKETRELQKEVVRAEKVDSHKYSFWRYVWKRNKEKYLMRKLFPSIIVFLILMIAFSIQNNIQSWYISSILNDCPATVFSVGKEEYEGLKDVYDLEVYYNYTYSLENVGVYPLFSKEDSGLAYGDLLTCGKFPEKENELIASKDYIKQVLGITNSEKALGKEILLGKDKFYISGVLSDIDTDEKIDLFNASVYYQKCNPVGLYVPYNILKQIGTEVDTTFKMVKLQNLYSSSSIYETVRKYLGGSITTWDTQLVEIQYLIDSILTVVFVGIAILAFIAIIFIKNEVQLELYYRRKELGYLQIFNLSKKRILHMVVFERSARSFIALGISTLLYIVCSLVIQGITGYEMMVSLTTLLVLILVILIYVIGITWFPCRKFLRKDIIELIV